MPCINSWEHGRDEGVQQDPRTLLLGGPAKAQVKVAILSFSPEMVVAPNPALPAGSEREEPGGRPPEAGFRRRFRTLAGGLHRVAARARCARRQGPP